VSFTEQAFFNLFLNSALSFLGGIGIVYLSLKIFRVDQSRWKLFLLSLPFMKIIWDIGRGIPATSYLLHSIDPLNLPPKHKYLMIGTGFSEWGPIFSVAFSVKDPNGQQYSISLPDFLGAWLQKAISPSFPILIVGCLVGVSIALLVVRFFSYYRFENERVKDRKKGTLIKELILDRFRKVDIYLSEKYLGTPFTGGFLKPFICIPKKTVELLNEEEKEAVIQHEIAHIKTFDLPITLTIKILGDIFWFVPGYRFLTRKIDRLREILADKVAVINGAGALHLASALVKLKTTEIDLRHNVLYSAFFRERSLLKERVDLLTNNTKMEKKPRFGWNKWYFRLLISVWTAGGVMIVTFGNNHEIGEMPEWIDKFLQWLGLI